MSDTRTSLYEGMFLMSSAAGADLNGSLAHIQEILDRAEAEVVTLRKWDERRLAYAIKGQKRGLYIISYFNAQRSRIANIERDCNLSENVVRAMMLRADHFGEEELALEKQEAEKGSTEAALRSDDAPAETATESKPEAEAPATEAPEPVAAAEGEAKDES